MYVYSDFNDSNYNTPARMAVYSLLIERVGYDCLRKNNKCYGLTDAVRSISNMNEKEVTKVASKLMSQWSKRSESIIALHRDYDYSPLNKHFNTPPTKINFTQSKVDKSKVFSTLSDIHSRHNQEEIEFLIANLSR